MEMLLKIYPENRGVTSPFCLGGCLLELPCETDDALQQKKFLSIFFLKKLASGGGKGGGEEEEKIFFWTFKKEAKKKIFRTKTS
jgi:hypothetical protein